MSTLAFCLLALVPGWFAGRRLAGRGHGVHGAPPPGAWFLALGFAALAGVAVYGYRLPWVPTWLLLRLEPLFLPATQAVAGFGVGLLAALEWGAGPGPVRRARAVLGAAALAAAALFLARLARPVTDLLDEPMAVHGVVLQTTASSCTPAAIATLIRSFAGDTTVTEREVAERAGTTRAGTHTIAALRVLREYGFRATLRRGLSVTDLVERGPPALLHVHQPARRGTDRHTVVLLEVDPTTRTVTLGNPLTGPQVVSFAALDGYWYGEAVFVTGA